jgi:catechol 2,3-dioxygenase-like lactoylglutathione lyase family enzyme
MKQQIAHVALVVADYDEALAFYTGKLRFTVVADTYQPAQDKRWVVIAPPGDDGGATLLLARAATPDQSRFVGNQAGGRVFLFLRTDDFWRDYQRGRHGTPAWANGARSLTRCVCSTTREDDRREYLAIVRFLSPSPRENANRCEHGTS